MTSFFKLIGGILGYGRATSTNAETQNNHPQSSTSTSSQANAVQRLNGFYQSQPQPYVAGQRVRIYHSLTHDHPLSPLLPETDLAALKTLPPIVRANTPRLKVDTADLAAATKIATIARQQVVAPISVPIQPLWDWNEDETTQPLIPIVKPVSTAKLPEVDHTEALLLTITGHRRAAPRWLL